MLTRFIILSLALACNLAPAAALNMRAEVDPNTKFAYVYLWGTIEPGDDTKFRDLILPHVRANHPIYQVNIYSPGGNVAAAMGIGEQIRLLQTRTTAPYLEQKIRNNRKYATGKTICEFKKDTGYMLMPSFSVGTPWCECASACFLVWASGTVREGGRMGIHRLYWPGSDFGNLSPGDARTQYAQAQESFTAYLKKLDVPQTLIDRLFATDSHNMYYLSWPEMELMQSTPYVEEMTYSKCGPDKTEHMSAKNNWTATQDVKHVECYRGILLQILADGARDYLAKYGP